MREKSEVLELHWLAGVEQDDKKGWQVRIVTRGVSSGEFVMWPVPIGLFPVLALGYRFSEGKLLP
ncbi:Tn5468, orf5, partial [Acidithiobacillus sp. GGI-221]